MGMERTPYDEVHAEAMADYPIAADDFEPIDPEGYNAFFVGPSTAGSDEDADAPF